ncbi:hypothetical protein Avbf_13534, partial [Armadillidium vulgare]
MDLYSGCGLFSLKCCGHVIVDMLTLESTITAGVFTPDDQQVYFGTTSGLLIVMDVHGATVSQDTLLDDTGINTLTWSCPKFKMEEGEDGSGK